ncbi:MAG: tetratricopeptide repeat protein [Rhodobacteraceae bacterium]|nr:tetratricopeptide repeat protein [Paracoccaceae bacterium]
MRLQSMGWLCVAGAFALAGCDGPGRVDADKALDPLNVIDESNLSELMLTVADPEEAVAYFRRAATERPERTDLQRGLARSLVRAGRATEAIPVWERLVEGAEATPEDRVSFAGALIRDGEWDRAKTQLDAVPPTHETFERYRLEAMIADMNQQWDRADSFYETAVGLTMRPAGVLNNWGFSKLSRGDHAAAERLFVEALGHDRTLFTAKNNLVLARGAQRNYTLPLIQMTQIERAELLHTLALTAVRQGDVAVGRGLLEEAIDSHPRHFEAAVRSLRALQNNVIN